MEAKKEGMGVHRRPKGAMRLEGGKGQRSRLFGWEIEGMNNRMLRLDGWRQSGEMVEAR